MNLKVWIFTICLICGGVFAQDALYVEAFDDGHERIFIHGEWAGTLLAPYATLILGQTKNKLLYGRFLGNGVAVHQDVKIYIHTFENSAQEPSQMVVVKRGR